MGSTSRIARLYELNLLCFTLGAMDGVDIMYDLHPKL